METTGNAGGVRNLQIEMGEKDREALLKEMGTGLVAVGNDCDFSGSTRTGSWLIDEMMIAGQ